MVAQGPVFLPNIPDALRAYTVAATHLHLLALEHALQSLKCIEHWQYVDAFCGERPFSYMTACSSEGVVSGTWR